MDDNVMRVLQMLQDGKISAKEAEMLIAALRGETHGAAAPAAPRESDEEKHGFPGFDRIKHHRLDLELLGDRISKAVGKVQPEKIVKRVQAQIRTATQASAHWGATVSARVRTWTEGENTRPENSAGLAEHADTHEQEFHLEPEAFVTVENPLGNVRITGTQESRATVVVRKVAWNASAEQLRATADRMEVEMHGTDSRLEIKVSAPDFFREGTVDLELQVPATAQARVSTRFGDVAITGINGRAEAVTTTGALSLRDLGGDVRAESVSGALSLSGIGGAASVATQSGDISAEKIGRGLSANSASGDVHIHDVEGGRVECKSVSGDVSAHRVGMNAPVDITLESVSGGAALKEAHGNMALKAVSGDVRAEQIGTTRIQAHTVSGDVELSLIEPFSGAMQVNTVSGDVGVALPEGSNVRVSLSTSSGEMRCEHDAHIVTATETLWTGEIGTGAGQLNIQTISGDTHIRRQ